MLNDPDAPIGRRGGLGLAVVGMLTSLGLSGALFFGGLVSAIEATDQASWTEVRAEIVNVEVRERAYHNDSGSRTGTYVDVTYRYEVGGKVCTRRSAPARRG